LDPQSGAELGHGASVPVDFVIHYDASVFQERRGVLVLGEIDDAVDPRDSLGVKLELGSALRSSQERRTPYSLEIAAMLELSRRAAGLPRAKVSPLLRALDAAVVVDLLQPDGVGSRDDDPRRRGALARSKGAIGEASLSGGQRSLSGRQRAGLGVADSSRAYRSREACEQREMNPFIHGRLR